MPCDSRQLPHEALDQQKSSNTFILQVRRPLPCPDTNCSLILKDKVGSGRPKSMHA